MSNHSKYPKHAGIYKLTCIVNNKIYIGKSINIYSRLNYHKNCEKKLKGRGYFQNALIKHGWKSFTVEILETVENFDKTIDNDNLLKREAYYIELFEATNRKKGYNICKFSTDNTGIKHSDETREKIRLANIGRKHSDETKKKMSSSGRGRVFSQKHKEGIRQSKLGKKLSNETKLKISNTKSGIPKSEEFKEKLRGRRHSEETKEKLRKPRSEEFKEKLRGRKLSEEHKAKLRKPKTEEAKEKLRGRKHSEETKEKMRKSAMGNTHGFKKKKHE